MSKKNLQSRIDYIVNKIEGIDPDFILWAMTNSMVSTEGLIPSLEHNPKEFWSDHIECLEKAEKGAEAFYPPDHPFFTYSKQLIEAYQAWAKSGARLYKRSVITGGVAHTKPGGQTDARLNMIVLCLWGHFTERTGKPQWGTTFELLKSIGINYNDEGSLARRWNMRLKKWENKHPEGEITPFEYYRELYALYKS